MGGMAHVDKSRRWLLHMEIVPFGGGGKGQKNVHVNVDQAIHDGTRIPPTKGSLPSMLSVNCTKFKPGSSGRKTKHD